MRRDRSVVDDPPALRRLRTHGGKGGARAQERPGQVDSHDIHPVLDAGFIRRARRAATPGIVEQHIDAAPGLHCRAKNPFDSVRITDITGKHQRIGMPVRGGGQRVGIPANKTDAVASLKKRFGCGGTDAAPGAGDDD